jgi:hypothetical protein
MSTTQEFKAIEDFKTGVIDVLPAFMAPRFRRNEDLHVLEVHSAILTKVVRAESEDVIKKYSGTKEMGEFIGNQMKHNMIYELRRLADELEGK